MITEKCTREDLDPPHRELSDRALGMVAALLVRGHIDFFVGVLEVHSSRRRIESALVILLVVGLVRTTGPARQRRV